MMDAGDGDDESRWWEGMRRIGGHGGQVTSAVCT
jgi:hypothetical protein